MRSDSLKHIVGSSPESQQYNSLLVDFSYQSSSVGFLVLIVDERYSIALRYLSLLPKFACTVMPFGNNSYSM